MTAHTECLPVFECLQLCLCALAVIQQWTNGEKTAETIVHVDEMLYLCNSFVITTRASDFQIIRTEYNTRIAYFHVIKISEDL